LTGGLGICFVVKLYAELLIKLTRHKCTSGDPDDL